MSHIPLPTGQATPLWERPPLKPIPELPPIDASRIIDMEKYKEMVAQEDRVRYLELKNEKDRPLLLIMFSIIKKEERLWKTPSSNGLLMAALYKQAAIELYGRTGELVSYQNIQNIWNNIKSALRHRITRAITIDKMSPEDMETFMWEYWAYPTTRFYREKMMDFEEELRRESSNSSRKRSQTQATETPPTTKSRKDDSFSSTSMPPMDSGEGETPEMNSSVEPLHQNQNLTMNPTSSEIETPKSLVLAHVEQPHQIPTSPRFRTSRPGPEFVQYDTPGIPHTLKRMSTAPQSNLQATPLWEGPPLKPIPELPPIDAARKIDMKKYEEMVAEEDLVRHLEVKNKTDHQLILIMFSIIKKEEGIWKTPNSNSAHMMTLYKKVAIELYARTGELVTYQNITKICNYAKSTFRERIHKAITIDKMSPEEMETYMWDLWLYPTARFLREELIYLEEELRKKFGNSYGKRSHAPPSAKRRESSASSLTSTSPVDSEKVRTPEMNPPVGPLHQNQNLTMNPTSSEIETLKPQVLVPVEPLHQNQDQNQNQTLPRFIIPKSEPEVIQIDDDIYEFKVESDMDYGTSGISNAPPEPTDFSSQDDYEIQLNVGGVSFSTMKSTLTKKSGWFRENLRSDYKKYIDRDFTHFRLILNYLRDDVIILPESIKEVQEIQREAMFYKMHELIGICMLKLEKMKKN